MPSFTLGHVTAVIGHHVTAVTGTVAARPIGHTLFATGALMYTCPFQATGFTEISIGAGILLRGLAPFNCPCYMYAF